MLLVIHLWPFFCFGFVKAMMFATIPAAVFSVCFLTISQVGHIVPETRPIQGGSSALDGTGALKNNCLSFYEHQIEQSHNFATDSWLCFYVSGGLNLQIEHHLFPGVNHCHLRELAPLVKALCQKHGIVYQESKTGFLEALYRHLLVLAQMSRPSHSN